MVPKIVPLHTCCLNIIINNSSLSLSEVLCWLEHILKVTVLPKNEILSVQQLCLSLEFQYVLHPFIHQYFLKVQYQIFFQSLK